MAKKFKIIDIAININKFITYGNVIILFTRYQEPKHIAIIINAPNGTNLWSWINILDKKLTDVLIYEINNPIPIISKLKLNSDNLGIKIANTLSNIKDIIK